MQLAETHPTTRETIMNWVRHPAAARVASQLDVWEVFKAVLCQDDRFVFVLDGLDNYHRQDDNREIFLQKLKSSVMGSRCRVLILSQDKTDIRQELSSRTTQATEPLLLEHKISTEDVGADVMSSARDVVERKLPRSNEKMKQEIAQRMAQKGDGTFLWIKLQQSQLRAHRQPEVLRRSIASLPRELSKTYEQNWRTICGKSIADMERAGKILAWVLHAMGILSIAELVEALATELGDIENQDHAGDSDTQFSDDEALDIDESYIDQEIVDICDSLVETRLAIGNDSPGGRTIHLVHSSVGEYFMLLSAVAAQSAESQPIALLSRVAAHTYLARVCICYLSRTDIWGGAELTEPHWRFQPLSQLRGHLLAEAYTGDRIP